MSLFQLIPFDIAERVIKFAIDNNGYSYRNDRCVSLSLLHSCHNWRIAFISVAFDCLTLKTSDTDLMRACFSKCGDFINPLNFPLERLVKSLKIDFQNWNNVYCGQADHWIKCCGIAEMRMSRLDSFDCNVWHSTRPGYNERYDVGALQEVVSFFKLVFQVMPSVQNVRFRRESFNWPSVDHRNRAGVVAQILDIFCGVGSVTLECNRLDVYVHHNNLFQYGNLTSITHKHNGSSEPTIFLDILIMNAANIVDVSLNDFPQSSIHYLLNRYHKSPIVYPRLESLKFQYIGKTSAYLHSFNDSMISSPPDFNHFPALKILDLCADSYPFKGNVFAEGINDTLEELNLFFVHNGASTDPALSLLSTQFVNLKRVSLTPYVPYTGIAENDVINAQQIQTIGNFIRLINQCSKNVNSLDSYIPADPCLYLDDPLCERFGRLRYLDVVHGVLSFSNILQILQKVPHLRYLSTRLDEKMPKIEGVVPSKLQKYIENLSPINTHFSMMDVKWPNRKVVRGHVRTSLLLAIACPNFSKVVFGHQKLDFIRSEFEELAETKFYKDYVDYGKRLLDRVERKYVGEPDVDEKVYFK